MDTTSTIVAYQLIFAAAEDKFITKVNALLDEGWQLYNPPFIRSQAGKDGKEIQCYYQTMVKYKQAIYNQFADVMA